MISDRISGESASQWRRRIIKDSVSFRGSGLVHIGLAKGFLWSNYMLSTNLLFSSFSAICYKVVLFHPRLELRPGTYFHQLILLRYCWMMPLGPNAAAVLGADVFSLLPYFLVIHIQKVRCNYWPYYIPHEVKVHEWCGVTEIWIFPQKFLKINLKQNLLLTS